MENSKKSICFVLEHYFKEKKGGSELQCYYLAKELIKRNWDVSYIRFSNGFFSKKSEDDGIKLYSIPRNKLYKRFHIQNFIINFTLKKLVKKIKAKNFYVRAAAILLPSLVKIKESYNMNIIWAFAHDDQVQKDGFLNYFKNKKISDEILTALKKIDCILFQTEYQKRLAKINLDLNGVVIRNGHPTPMLGKTNNRENIIVWIGRLRGWKHPEIFIELANNLKEYNYKFYLIGANSDYTIKKKIVESISENNNIEFLGELSNDEVHKVLEKSKILVNTSYAEGFSNTFIEAWMRGVPIISYYVDPDNIIRENKLGIVGNSHQKNKQFIISLLENDKEWQEYSQRCRKYASKHFGIGNVTDKLIKILHIE